MAPDSTRDFFDDLAPDYHLIFPDWDARMRRRAAALAELVRPHLGPGPGPHRVLDCFSASAPRRSGRPGR